MDIYNDDELLDFEKATRQLRAAEFVSNKEARQSTIAMLTTAALIDIADSLRTLAVESALAMGRDGVFDDLATTEGDNGPEPSSIAELAIVNGMRVRTLSTGYAGTLTGASGIDQGEAWAEVAVDRGGVVRAWASDLELADRYDDIVNSPVPLAGVATEAEAPALRTDEDDDGEPAVGGYETDESSALAARADAVAALKARQKAAKKKGGK